MGSTQYRHFVRRCLLYQWSRSSRRQRLSIFAGLLVGAMVLYLMLHRYIIQTQSFPHWNPKLIHNENSSQRTIHFPFRTGCPQDCHPYRDMMGLSTNRSEGFRITVEWYFGEPDQYDQYQSWESQNGNSTYNQGINFQCPKSFVTTFQASASDLSKSAVQHLSKDGRDFSVHKQKRMHASLLYLCCLQAKEAEDALIVIDRWINSTEFDFILRFDEIQSWWEAPNSVTNIVVVDQASQKIMMRMNHNLNQMLKSVGVPVIIPREDQMPFHSTVAGFRYCKNGEDHDPKCEIESKLPIIYALVQAISEKYRNQWNPRLGNTFRVRHKPMRSPAPSRHTHALIDNSVIDVGNR